MMEGLLDPESEPEQGQVDDPSGQGQVDEIPEPEPDPEPELEPELEPGLEPESELEHPTSFMNTSACRSFALCLRSLWDRAVL